MSRVLYYPYGETRYSEGALPTDFGFTGQRRDGSTRLVFMHARYYHAGLGRFISADSIVPEAGNPQRSIGTSTCLEILLDIQTHRGISPQKN